MIRVAVIGAGSSGARHALTLLELGHEVFVHDPVADAPEGTIRVATLEAALVGVDAVIVASPSALHVDHALAAIEAGRPVLVEKPLAVDVRGARRIVEAAARKGVLCATAMNLRQHPALLRLREWVRVGRLGRVLLATASFGYDLRRWRPNVDYRTTYSARRDLGGGILLDAIHELDYLLWLLGPVVAVSAMTATVSDLELDAEDAVAACLRFASGALATVDLNFFEPAYRRGCTVVGAEAVAVWDWNEATITLRGEGETTVPVPADVADTYRAEVAEFVAAVAGERSPSADGLDGYAAVAVADAVRRSAEHAREAVPEPW